jgi:transposase
MTKNIFPVKSQLIQDFFTAAPSLDKVLIVAMDYAKKSHTVQFCRGNGELLLKKALTVYNTPKGLVFFHKQIEKTMKYHHIKKEQVLIVSEEPPLYLYNFIYRSRLNKFSWAKVNPAEAKKYRETLRASSDIIDLTGIAGATISRRAVPVQDIDPIYTTMKQAARARRRLVALETALKNRIHSCSDLLFPGFLNEEKSGISPFSAASLWLMRDKFSALKIRRMKLENLTKKLRLFRIQEPSKKALQLKQYANEVLEAPPEITIYKQTSLTAKITLLEEARRSIFVEENELARCLVQTPGFYLTSIPGIAIILAGCIVAELGNPADWLPLKNQVSYAGIVPRSKQTGGKEKEPSSGHLPPDCNHVLKDYLIQAAKSVGKNIQSILTEVNCNSAHTLYRYFQQVVNRKGHSRIATGKKIMKVMRRLVDENRIYLPEEWLDPNCTVSSEDNFIYHEKMLKSVQAKWSKYDLSEIPEEMNYLTSEKKILSELKSFIKSK